PAVSPASRPAPDPLVVISRPPAGTYAIEAVMARPGAGRVALMAEGELGPLWTWDVAGASSRWQTTVTIPAALHGMRTDADAPARQAIDRIPFHAIAVQPPRTWLREARPADAVRYGAAVVFVSGGAYVERAGTWIAGGAEADLFILQDRPAPVHLF